MCELCMKHGAGKKWYLNAQHYSDEIVEKYNLRDYLMDNTGRLDYTVSPDAENACSS